VAVCSPPLGLLLDRVSARRVIIPALTIFGCAFASLALLTPRLWHLYAVFVVIGIVGNGTAQMAYTRAVSSWFESRRGVALSVMLSGGAFGSMVLPPIAQALIDAAGWRTAFAVLGLMVLVVGLPGVVAFVRERPAAPGLTQPACGASVRDGLASRAFWILVVVLFCSSIAQNGAITHLAALLTDRGVSAAGAALAVSALGAAGLAGRLATGWHVSFVLLVLAAAGTYLLSWADTLPAGILGAAMIGFGMGGESDITPYMLSRYFGLRSFSTLYGLTWTAYAVAGAIGPVLMGQAFDATGSYEALLARLAAATLAVAAITLLLPRYGTGTLASAARTATSPRMAG